MLSAAIEGGDLVRVVWASLLAASVITGAYSVALYGATRYVEARRARRRGSALPYGVLAVIGGVVFVGAVVLGLIVMTSN